MLRRTKTPSAIELRGLRALLQLRSDGTVDSDRLDQLFPLIEWLDGRTHGRAPVSEVPSGFRPLLKPADEDGLIQWVNKILATGSDNLIRYAKDWQTESVTRDLDGSRALLFEGKSIEEILELFGQDDARHRPLSSFRAEALWHVGLAPVVPTALSEWRGQFEIFQAAVRELRADGTLSRTKGTPKAETNLKVREILRCNRHATIREIHEESGCSMGAISECPAWKAIMEERRGRKPKKPKGIPFTGKVDGAVGDLDESYEQVDEQADRVKQLNALIADQKADHEPSPLEDDPPPDKHGHPQTRRVRTRHKP